MAGLYIDDSGRQVQVAELALISGKQQTILGNGERDLILRTAGNVQIQVGNKFYPLTFFTDTTTDNTIVSSKTTILESDKDLSTLVYPGDGNYVYIKQSKSFYITSNLSYIKLNVVSLPGTTDKTLYLSYNTEQTLNGTQKLRLSLNVGNINSFSDIASYTKDSVYAGQLLYSNADAKHYTLTNIANPSTKDSWSELYLALKTGGTVSGPVSINLTSASRSQSALHLNGKLSSSDVKSLTVISSLFSIGASDYSTGLGVWTNDTTYFQNFFSDSTKGFKFITSRTDGTLVNPLSIYANGIGLFGEPEGYTLTLNGSSKFTEVSYLVKGAQSIDYVTGSIGQGYNLGIDPIDNKWLLEVDKLLVRDQLTAKSNFSSKSIDGSYWSNPAIKIRSVQHLDEINVYTLAEFSGNYKDVTGTKVLMTLAEKLDYALVDAPVDYTGDTPGRNVIPMHIMFGIGDRSSIGTLATESTFVLNDSAAYVAVPATYAYDGTVFTPDDTGDYILNQTVNIIYAETDSLDLVQVDDLLYYASWNPDGTEKRVIAARVDSINDTGAILHVYNSETVDLNQELIFIARSTDNNGIHFNGIDPSGDYIEHLVNPVSFRDLFSNFYYSTDGYEAFPRNTYAPTTDITVSKFGALTNLIDSELALTGTPQFGLYSSNSYLKGNFVVNLGIYNNVPVVTTTTDKFLMLASDNTFKQVDLSTKITNWDTAYGWGNHALAGYTVGAIDPAHYVVRESITGTIDGVNTSFTLLHAPVTGKEMIFINGVLTIAYTIVTNAITFTSAPTIGTALLATYIY